MRKFKNLLFAGSVLTIFLFNLVVNLDGSSMLGKDVVAKKTEKKIKYEDKFDVTLYLPGPSMQIKVCCEEDKTDGCWRIWRLCSELDKKKVN